MSLLLLSVLLFSTPEGHDSIIPQTHTSNQWKMMMVSIPAVAELGGVVVFPAAWFAAWGATGFETDVTYDACTGCPTGCEAVINREVLWSVVGIGAAGFGCLGGKLGHRIGSRVDRDLSLAEYQAGQALLNRKQGKIELTHIWYLGAGGYEYGYHLNRFSVFRFNYVIPAVRFGFGIEGPSYYPESAKDQQWLGPMLFLLIMPYADSYKIGKIDFLRTLYMFGGIRPGKYKTPNFNAGLAFSVGSILTFKGGACQIVKDTLTTEFKPTFYGGVEIEYGSWFFSKRFKAQRFEEF